MHAHILEPPARQTKATDSVASRYPVTAVGTFAAGQSPQGSFHVIADAKVGTFASRPAMSHSATTA